MGKVDESMKQMAERELERGKKVLTLSTQNLIPAGFVVLFFFPVAIFFPAVGGDCFEVHTGKASHSQGKIPVRRFSHLAQVASHLPRRFPSRRTLRWQAWCMVCCACM